jgi:serine phosphatase RsbU (regulator of sigma subunit)
MVTVICAMSAPPYKEFRVASAGHVPPLVAAANSPAQIIELPVGVPLGVVPGFRRSSASVPLDEGAAILLYTDGLVERRGEALDEGARTIAKPISARRGSASLQ